MANYAKKSTYGSNNNGNRSSSMQKGNGDEKVSSTTHYAYILKRDDDGNVIGKDYVNEMQVYENEGKFGPYLKVRITGNIPTADLFIVRKKGK